MFTVMAAASRSLGEGFPTVHIKTTGSIVLLSIHIMATAFMSQSFKGTYDLTFWLKLLDSCNPRLPDVLGVDNKHVVLRETHAEILLHDHVMTHSLPSTFTLPEVVKNRRGRLGSATQNTASWRWRGDTVCRGGGEGGDGDKEAAGGD